MCIRTLACWSTYALIVSDVGLFVQHVYLFFKSKHKVMFWSCFILLFFWRGVTSLIVMKEKNRHSWLIVWNETHRVINTATAWMSNYLRYLRKSLTCVWQRGDDSGVMSVLLFWTWPSNKVICRTLTSLVIIPLSILCHAIQRVQLISILEIEPRSSYNWAGNRISSGTKFTDFRLIKPTDALIS